MEKMGKENKRKVNERRGVSEFKRPFYWKVLRNSKLNSFLLNAGEYTPFLLNQEKSYSSTLIYMYVAF